jgi:hypothetical protein
MGVVCHVISRMSLARVVLATWVWAIAAGVFVGRVVADTAPT